MEINKTRCHFSIILEKTGAFLLFWFLLAFDRIDDIIDAVTAPEIDKDDFQHMLIICIGLIVLLLIVVGYHFLVWRKTYIYIDGDTFVVERNTLNRKKNTFGIANIANINLEQNLFERIIGTYRLKLDMDSLSSASDTDVSIVLSAEKAAALQKELLALMKRDAAPENVTAHAETHTENGIENAEYPGIPYATAREVLSHWFFSISATLLFIALALIIGLPLLSWFGNSSLLDIDFSDIFDKNAPFTIFILIITYVYPMIKQLFSLYHFQCFRRENELIIRYGFFKKQDFTIPIERVNTVQIIQPPLARLTGLMQARLICIGIGDSDGEKPQLTLCMKKTAFYQRMRELLPEFSTEMIQETNKRPHGAAIMHFTYTLFLLVCFSAGFWIAVSFWAGNNPILTASSLIICGLISFFIILYQLCRYFSMSVHFGKEHLVIHGGAFQKQIWLVPYHKIQFARFHQNPLSRLFKIVKGDIFILASLGNSVLPLPFIRCDQMDRLQKELLR